MKRVHASPARAACVCWAIASDTRIAYGSRAAAEGEGSAARVVPVEDRVAERGREVGRCRSPTYDRRPELEVIDALRRGVLDPANDWPELRDACLAAERAGWDSLWVDDHLLADEGDRPTRSSRAGRRSRPLATVTERVRLGLLVAANTFRNPGLTAKLATTVDHLSGGRVRPRPRRRLVRARARRVRARLRVGLRRAARPSRRGGRADPAAARRGAGHPRRAASTRCTTPCARRGRSRHGCRSSSAAPGPTKTLRTTARHADLWNGYGAPERIAAGQRRPARAVRRDRPRRSTRSSGPSPSTP